MKPVEIDGSYGEGGGQILRTAVALSALTGKPVRVYNIRAKRPNPGLQAQHLTGVKAVAMISKARVDGLRIRSTEITMYPQRITGGNFSFDVGTAGSISLVLQSVLPALAFAAAPSSLKITGGTDVAWSPPIDYMRNVFFKLLAKMGYHVDCEVKRRGHYPKGGGQVVVYTHPVEKLSPITLMDLGEVQRIQGVSHCVRLPRHVAERQASTARRVLEAEGYRDVEIAVESYPPGRDPHLGPGSGIVLWAETSTGTVIGADALGERGKPAEKVGEEAAAKLLEELRLGAAVDKHASDMLIPYMAVADGSSSIKTSELTMHTATAIHVVESFLPVKFEVEGKLGSPAVIRVNGVGMRNPSLAQT